MFDVMNKAALALMLSVGHRTKLFDVMHLFPHQQVMKLHLKQASINSILFVSAAARYACLVVLMSPLRNNFF
ncbi:hypothetical protein [Nitrosopumilus sp.]|uniref:hypothetical protein n=1 Tax=Nitrosopumilus sp. TaxID=2024843 RepID=UPI003B637D75